MNYEIFYIVTFNWGKTLLEEINIVRIDWIIWKKNNKCVQKINHKKIIYQLIKFIDNH